MIIQPKANLDAMDRGVRRPTLLYHRPHRQGFRILKATARTNRLPLTVVLQDIPDNTAITNIVEFRNQLWVLASWALFILHRISS